MNSNLEKNNQVILKGKVSTTPTYSHSVMGEGFYEFILSVPRLSNEVDLLPITISERLLGELKNDGEVAINGQLRSYNKLEGERSRLILTIFAREILDSEQISSTNQISITGYVCKEPIYRTTPFGREITDLLVAVNRAYNKSDYLPCIAWGRNARFAGDLEVGEKIELTGRIQSRKYQKKINETESETRTAYEVSVATIMSIVCDQNEEEEDFPEEHYDNVIIEDNQNYNINIGENIC
ncbi:MAG: single-stranded DNA-binding protein [Clostridia bacterium]|nr:single-stranded DNA-binding protein [Clostridia bacterium]